MFPLATEGERKGHFVPIRDEKGNIVVDPASLITKDPFFIDYNLYKRFKQLSAGCPHIAQRITRKEKDDIRKLFAKHEPVDGIGPKDTDLQKFLKKSKITRAIIGEAREGQTAGTKDIKVVGQVRKK